MKILLFTLLFLIFSYSNSQNFIEGIFDCSKYGADEKLKKAVGVKAFNNHFKLAADKAIIEVYNEKSDRLERLTLEEFKQSDYPATQLWINYLVTDGDLVLTKLLFPYNLNCTTSWDIQNTKEIIDPYLKALQDDTIVDLREALRIGKDNGLREISDWNIDYEQGKLVWTLKGSFENNKFRVLKLNSRTGKVLTDHYELAID